MARTLKSKVRTLNKGETPVLLPGPTRAEPWEAWIVGAAQTECVLTCATPAENPWRRGGTLALPVAQVNCQPLWLPNSDLPQLAGVVPLQLELRGLQSRGGTAIFDSAPAGEVEGRTLITVGVLPAGLPEEFQPDGYKGFDLSARYLPLPEDSLTLWREHDQIVAAVTRGPNLAYFQSLGENEVGERLLQNLRCLLLGLEQHRILAPLRQLVVWAGLSPAELAALEIFRLPVVQDERPTPRLPSSPWKLVPPAVTEARQGREAWRWRFRAILLVALLYVMWVGWTVAHFWITSAKVHDLEQWTNQHAPHLAALQSSEDAWSDLRSAIDEKVYPVELLYHTAKSIPKDQLHLTLFETQTNHLLIKGEAKNVAAAFQFFDALKKEPAFAGYTWQMAPPHLLPNDLAQFQIEGTPASN